MHPWSTSTRIFVQICCSQNFVGKLDRVFSLELLYLIWHFKQLKFDFSTLSIFHPFLLQKEVRQTNIHDLFSLTSAGNVELRTILIHLKTYIYSNFHILSTVIFQGNCHYFFQLCNYGILSRFHLASSHFLSLIRLAFYGGITFVFTVHRIAL